MQEDIKIVFRFFDKQIDRFSVGDLTAKRFAPQKVQMLKYPSAKNKKVYLKVIFLYLLVVFQKQILLM